MHGWLFLLLWILIPFLWYLTLKFAGLSLQKISLPGFLISFISLYQYIGFPILLFELDEYRAEFVTDQDLILKAWAITSITTFLICIGSVIARGIIGRINYTKFFDSQWESMSNVSRKKVIFLACLGLAVLFYYVMSVGFYNIALVMAVQGEDIRDITLARSKMGNDYGVGYHWLNFFMKDILIFISFASLAQRFRDSKEGSLLILIALQVPIFFSLLMATEKALFVDYILGIAVVYLLVKNKGELSYKIFIYLILFIVSCLIVFYIIFMGNDGIVAGFNSIISRGLTGSLQPSYHYLDYFPNYHDWLYGKSFPNPAGIFAFTPYNLTVEVMNFVQPDHLQSGVIGTMPTIYWGELYANFGYYGLILVPVIIGFFLYAFNYFLFNLGFNSINIALFGWLLIHYKNLSITSASMFVFDLNLYLMLVFYFYVKKNFRMLDLRNS